MGSLAPLLKLSIMTGRIIRKETEKRLPFPTIGRIACGEKSEKGYPRSLDWFKASGKYASLFHEAYGEQPDTIQIVFPSDDPELVCREEYEFRDNAGKLVAKGDGETFRVWSEKSKSYVTLTTNEHPTLMDMVSSKYPKCEWKITLTLNFIIPKIRGVMGLWSFSTKGSASTIPQVRDAFDALIEQSGHASGVICDLSVKIHTSNHPGTASKYPVVMLTPNESRENLQMIAEAKKPITLIGDGE